MTLLIALFIAQGRLCCVLARAEFHAPALLGLLFYRNDNFRSKISCGEKLSGLVAIWEIGEEKEPFFYIQIGRIFHLLGCGGGCEHWVPQKVAMGAGSGCSLQQESVPCSRRGDTSHWSCQIFPFPRQALCLIWWSHWSSNFHALWVSSTEGAQKNWCCSFRKRVMGKDLFLDRWNSWRIPAPLTNTSNRIYLQQGNSSKFLVKGFPRHPKFVPAATLPSY